MNLTAKPAGFIVLAIIAVLCTLYLRPTKDSVSDSAFVGKWQSSRLETPIHLYPNGEWEIKKDDGIILQYGVWRYEDKNVIWSFMSETRAIHDPNPVLSFTPDEFTLKEKDGNSTTFKRLAER